MKGGDTIISWQTHALIIGLAFVLLLIGALLAKYRKPQSWFKLHKAVAVSGGILWILSVLLMVYGVPFTGIHAYVGALSVIVLIAVILLGGVFSRAKKAQVRNIHLWLGRILLLLVIATMILGLFQAGVL